MIAVRGAQPCIGIRAGERKHRRMISLIIGVLSGIIAISPLIVSRRPDAADALGKIAAYAGWIGICVFCWGIREIVFAILGVGLLSTHPLSWAFWLAAGVADFGVGLLLGFGLISRYALSKSAEAMRRGEQVRAKLAPFQATLGIAQIAMSVLYFVL
jgi:hypothetical protein